MDITILLLSFLGGVLTVLAPCVFTLLPVILGSSADGKSNLNKAFKVIFSLSASIFIFTLLIKSGESVLDIDEDLLNVISGLIIFTLGIFTVVPEWWDSISFKFGLSAKSGKALNEAQSSENGLSDYLVGLSLGPVFTSCSPTYFFILAQILPADFGLGIVYLLSYTIGLFAVLMLVAFAGNSLVKKLKWAVNPHGVFKRMIGILFIVIGWSIIFGLHKDIQTFIVQDLEFLNITTIENDLLQNSIDE